MKILIKVKKTGIIKIIEPTNVGITDGYQIEYGYPYAFCAFIDGNKVYYCTDVDLIDPNGDVYNDIIDDLFMNDKVDMSNREFEYAAY